MGKITYSNISWKYLGSDIILSNNNKGELSLYFTSKQYCMAIGLVAGLAGCGSGTSTATADKTCSNYASTSLSAIVAGDIVSLSADPFNRYINFHGLTVFAKPDNTNAFLINVTKTYRDMLGGDLGYRSSCVDTLKTKFTANKIAQRLWRTTKPTSFTGLDNLGYEGQDLIQEHVSGQVNAVVEHLLHTITVLGLTEVFPNKWDYTDTNSDLYLSMQQAIGGGFYDASDHIDLKSSDLAGYHLVIQQEFAYMAILTAWGLKAQVWPDSEGEWTLTTAAEVEANLPLFWKLYEDTIKGFLVAPVYSDLLARFPDP